MKKLLQKTGRLLGAVCLGLFLTAGFGGRAYGLEAGSYVVTVTPSYSDPETGAIEDPGNNEAIGQGMTQKLCGPRGLLEVEAGGEMYLTVRYYLSQFVSDVSFEERVNGSFAQRSPKKMQTIAPVEGSANIDEKYGYTDWRIKISSTSSVFRGKAYVEPMGRNVVYFFTMSSPSPGKGDFISSLRGTEGTKAQSQTPAEGAGKTEGARREVPEVQAAAGGNSQTAPAPKSGEEGGFYNEGGQEDTPVTGIPQKSKKSPAVQTTGASLGKEEEAYGSAPAFSTGYDLSQVDIKKARALTKPILENAVGITNLSDVQQEAKDLTPQKKPSGPRLMMFTLFGVCALVLAGYGVNAGRRRMHERSR